MFMFVSQESVYKALGRLRCYSISYRPSLLHLASEKPTVVLCTVDQKSATQSGKRFHLMVFKRYLSRVGSASTAMLVTTGESVDSPEFW